MSGWVYIVTNKAIPGLVKVGYTTRSDIKLRLQEFNRAGLPYPYEEAYALWVEEPRLIEQRVHQALTAHRENKEWFRCSVKQARETIEKIAGPESAKATIQKIAAQHPGILTEFVRKDSVQKSAQQISEEIQASIQKAKAEAEIAESRKIKELTARLSTARTAEEPARQHHIRQRKQQLTQKEIKERDDILWGCLVPLIVIFGLFALGSC